MMILVGLVLLMTGCDQHQQAEKTKESTADRPNIVFILTDDQRFDSLGYAGNNIIQTPEMDKLAQEGVYFKNALVTTPICSASRASIFSGRYERAHRYTFGPDPLRPEFVEDSYPSLLKKAGYYSGFIGKFGVGMPEPEAMFDEFEYLWVDDDPARRENRSPHPLRGAEGARIHRVGTPRQPLCSFSEFQRTAFS
jgi:arylsulfatase A-like enzyme